MSVEPFEPQYEIPDRVIVQPGGIGGQVLTSSAPPTKQHPRVVAAIE
jgi:hypothetical protein